MLFCDVNILLHAIKPDQHEDSTVVKLWLDSHIVGAEPVGVSELVLSAMTRIATHPRLYEKPLTPAQCMQFADALLDAPSAQVVRPGTRHWSTFVTLDRGFTRFDGLRVLNPLDPDVCHAARMNSPHQAT